MKQLKTAQEFLDDHTNYGCCDGYLPISEQIKNAMRAYAEQFIEAAAEEAKVSREVKDWNSGAKITSVESFFAYESRFYQVDKQSILKLKEQLK